MILFCKSFAYIKFLKTQANSHINICMYMHNTHLISQPTFHMTKHGSDNLKMLFTYISNIPSQMFS